MTNSKYVPKRRFKEFESNGEWEKRKLTDFIELFSGLTYSPNDVRKSGTLVLRSSNIKNGEIVDADNVFVTPAKATSENVKPGDIIVVVRNGSRSLIGKHARVKCEKPNTVIGAFMAGMHTEHSLFVNALLDTPKFGEEIEKNMGATINQITGTMFSEMEFIIPDELEQDIIGDFFQTIDSLLSLHQHKLAKLKDLKKAYLSEMFPAEGERVPKRRLPGFEGEWSTKKLREITSLITKGTTPLEKSGEGEVNFIKVENLDASNGKILSCSKISSEEHNGYLKRSQLNENDILFSIAGTLGRIGIVESRILPANTNQALAIIRNKRSNLRYLAIALKSGSITNFILRNPTIGAQPNLSLEQVGSLEIPFPSLDEQKQIGEFFHKLDQSITLQQQKLDKLKDLKKAYLNELFV
jgi:type I restriction enzyme S subunit